MADPTSALTEQDLSGEELPDWRMLIDRLHGSFDVDDFVQAAGLVDAITVAGRELDHYPDLDLTADRLDVRLMSRDVGGVTSRDVALARAISALARDAGATPRPERTLVLELGLDTVDEAEVRPFWAALLGYDTVEAWGELQLRDPTGRGPSIWFQPTDGRELPRQRWHLDVRVPPETVEERMTAVIAAGGVLVDAGAAPAYWILADPHGNRACLTTWQGRDPV